MRHFLVLAATLCFFPSSVVAQTLATFAGVVLADSSERPIANAQVTISGQPMAARTDSAGAFLLAGIPAGRHQVVVRAIGYAEFRTLLTFRAGERQDADLLLTPTVQSLTQVDVTAAKSASGNNPRIAEFDERKKIGIGHFLTQEYFEKGEGRKLGDLLIAAVPGIRTQTILGRRYLSSSRGLISINLPPRCYPAIIIDDMVLYTSNLNQPLFEIDQIDPSTIAAVEFYTVAQMPQQFNRGGNAPCGALVIWSRYGPLKK